MSDQMFWTLDADGEPVPCSSEEWTLPSRGCGMLFKVAANNVPKQIKVSTVFLGIDVGWNPDAPPLIWETMVFGGMMDRHMERCSGSRKDALVMHLRVLQEVRAAEAR